MGAVAVTLSVMRIGGRKAVVGFVIGVAGYLVAGYMLDVTLLRNFPIIPNGTNYLTPLHPLLVLESYLNTANYHAPSVDELAGYSAFAKLYLSHPFGVYATVTCVLSFGMLTFCSLWVRMIGQGQSQWVYQLKKKLRLGKAQGERRRQPRTVWTNPIAWREAATRGKVAAGIVGKWAFVLIGWGMGALLIWLYHTKRLPAMTTRGGVGMPLHLVFRNILITLLLLELAVITLVALYMSASCVSREREDRTLDLILTTPVTPKLYIWGKLRGLVSFLSMMLTVPVVTLAMVSAYAWVGQVNQWPLAMVSYSVSTRTASYPLMIPEAAILLVMMLVPFVGFCVMVGMNWSVKSKGVLGAVIWSVGILSVISLVLGFCGYQAVSSIPVIGPLINSFSPVTHLLVIINPYENVAGMLEQPVPGRWNLFMGACVATLGYGVMVYVLLLNIVRSFDQTVRQLSGNG
jgi:ABC-type transport system involved in multi-copper enzyme maturation permease subunit